MKFTINKFVLVYIEIIIPLHIEQNSNTIDITSFFYCVIYSC